MKKPDSSLSTVNAGILLNTLSRFWSTADSSLNGKSRCQYWWTFASHGVAQDPVNELFRIRFSWWTKTKGYLRCGHSPLLLCLFTRFSSHLHDCPFACVSFYARTSRNQPCTAWRQTRYRCRCKWVQHGCIQRNQLQVSVSVWDGQWTRHVLPSW